MGLELLPLVTWGVVLVGNLVAWFAAGEPITGVLAFAMGWTGFGLGLCSRRIQAREDTGRRA